MRVGRGDGCDDRSGVRERRAGREALEEPEGGESEKKYLQDFQLAKPRKKGRATEAEQGHAEGEMEQEDGPDGARALKEPAEENGQERSDRERQKLEVNDDGRKSNGGATDRNRSNGGDIDRNRNQDEQEQASAEAEPTNQTRLEQAAIEHFGDQEIGN